MREYILFLIYPVALLLDSELRKSKTPIDEFVSMNSSSFKKGRYLALFTLMPISLITVLMLVFLPMTTLVVGKTLVQSSENLNEVVGNIHQAQVPKEYSHSSMKIIVTELKPVAESTTPESTPVDETLIDQEERLEKLRERFKSIEAGQSAN